MNNYEFCADYAARLAAGKPNFKVLDFGCGAGQIVAGLLDKGLDAYGCDPFYEGGSHEADVPANLAKHVIKMDGPLIPFPDASFDLVVTNTVLEHVDDLDVSVSEIARVLKPGAACLAIFPHFEVWREGHCEIPLLHRFPKGSNPRIYYAAALRSLGFGANKDGIPPIDWARRTCNWLDRWCHYRRLTTIRSTFREHLSEPKHIEAEWTAKRYAALARLPTKVRIAIARKAAGLVITAAKL